MVKLVKLQRFSIENMFEKIDKNDGKGRERNPNNFDWLDEKLGEIKGKNRVKNSKNKLDKMLKKNRVTSPLILEHRNSD